MDISSTQDFKMQHITLPLSLFIIIIIPVGIILKQCLKEKVNEW